ncbi:unnamed protein product [Hanseniaspora opuntiae]
MAILKNFDLAGNDVNVMKPDWLMCIDKICLLAVKNSTVETILTIRGIFYDLIAHCIPADLILQRIIMWVLENGEFMNIKPNAIIKIIEYGSVYDERMKLGSKDIFHLEGFITKMILETTN